MPSCEILSHHLLVSVAWRFTLNRFPICLRQQPHTHTHTHTHTNARTHIHTHTHTLRHNLILLYCPNPHLLSRGPQEEGIYAKQEIHRQAHLHICSNPHTRANTHTHTQTSTCTSSSSPVVSQMKRCQLLHRFYRNSFAIYKSQTLLK